MTNRKAALKHSSYNQNNRLYLNKKYSRKKPDYLEPSDYIFQIPEHIRPPSMDPPRPPSPDHIVV